MTPNQKETGFHKPFVCDYCSKSFTPKMHKNHWETGCSYRTDYVIRLENELMVEKAKTILERGEKEHLEKILKEKHNFDVADIRKAHERGLVHPHEYEHDIHKKLSIAQEEVRKYQETLKEVKEALKYYAYNPLWASNEMTGHKAKSALVLIEELWI